MLQRNTPNPEVGGGVGHVPYNTRVVTPYDPTADSALIDVYTGIMSDKKLTKIRERAVYDTNALSYAPLASTGTGVLFPGSVEAKVMAESELRTRPTTFKGPSNLMLSNKMQTSTSIDKCTPEEPTFQAPFGTRTRRIFPLLDSPIPICSMHTWTPSPLIMSRT